MSDETTSKSTQESSIGADASAAGSASGALGLGASASSKKTEERKKPKKLGQKTTGDDYITQKATPGDADLGDGVDANLEQSPPVTPEPKAAKERSMSRRHSRGRVRSTPPSDTEELERSDVSAKAIKRNRNRNRGKALQPQLQQEQSRKGGGPLGSVDEVGETVNGAVDQVGGLVDGLGGTVSGVTDGVKDLATNTVGKTLKAPTQALGVDCSKKKKKKGGEEGEEGEGGGDNEQLRLRLDLNLDIEIQLKAKIHGDLTLGLLN